jgi:hypothetical protein
LPVTDCRLPYSFKNAIDIFRSVDIELSAVDPNYIVVSNEYLAFIKDFLPGFLTVIIAMGIGYWVLNTCLPAGRLNIKLS